MNKIIHFIAVAALAGCSLQTEDVGEVSQALVTFDPATGTGFVGKGDVQLALGLNNPQLQASAAGISFSYSTVDAYDAVCTWITGEGTRGEKTHNVSHATTSLVSSAVAYDARMKNQITGFILNGFSSVTTSGTVPVIGEPCPGNQGHGGTWSSVELSGSSGGLSVTLGTNTVLLQ